MTTLIRRATPSQAKIYRIVHGAVRNAADVHPNMTARQMASSIAKRAAGTLTAQWPEVLAAASESSSVMAAGAWECRPRPPGADSFSRNPARRASRARARRSPLRLLRREVGIMAGAARKAGETEREAALVEVLRLLAQVEP